MPAPYRHTAPVRPEAATGQVAAVYAQMEQDFLLADGPLMSLSPAPAVLAATWALLREAELAGAAARTDKEAVAGAVSLANRCPFCTEAHSLLAHGAGDHRLAEAARSGRAPEDAGQAALLAWAAATRTPGDQALARPPFPASLAPEFVGTVLVTHFINRMVTALLDEQALLPEALRHSVDERRTAALAVAKAARLTVVPGAGLTVLGGSPAPSPGGATPAWAGDGVIGPAYLALRAAASEGGGLLTDLARAAVLDALATWDGTHPPLGGDPVGPYLAGLAAPERPAARLALLTALAPYRLAEADVAAWRAVRPGADDGELTRLLAFGAFAAVERVAGWIGG
ncbi:DNA-binding protein [Kitasatospora sp. NBC_01300]|uniref:DNA-binding protein n=1 Tax=Kitasatospora sp. NBC_01300 TaxID=2903574 RepID=UPI00352D2A6F|nr:carboxymuconolactone decarboxylase family protein [Kitasatospora sp. NBC_01300]